MTAIRPFLIVLVLLALTACGTADPRDRALGLERRDYRAIGGTPAATPPPDTRPAPPPVPPQLPPLEGDGELDDPAPGPEARAILSRPVDIRVAGQIPIAEVVEDLAHQARVGVVIDPVLEGIVRVSLSGVPLGSALAAIGRQVNFVYRIEGGVLLVERDRPVVRIYRIDQPDMVRRVDGGVAASSELDTVGTGSGGTADRNGSSIAIRNHTDGAFWNDAIRTLAAALGIPGDDAAQIADPADDRRPRLSVNPRTGVIAVYGDRHAQDVVRRVIAGLRRTTGRQVLIEARVVEVALDEGYEAGIDWSAILSGDVTIAGRFGAPAARIANGVDDVLGIRVSGSDIDALVGLAARFGAVRTLSSPRLTVLNNQTALLKVAENAVYFTLDVERETDDDTGDVTLTVNSKLNTVPIGLVLSVQPAIAADERSVVMTVRPTITRIAREVADPGVAIASQNQVESLVPVVEVRELDSVLRIRSGEIMIMGGLMEERARFDESGAPVLKDLPWVGRLFRADTDASHTVELVVFLRATILPDDTGGTIAPADIDLYRGFTTDPRPLPFPAPSPSPAVTPPSAPAATPGRPVPESESEPQ
ncbi:hypothetical protein P7L70_18980 [Tistrella mobilis]|uniref:hypothetical protein n=1 Tax=Tistrella mobilis TaxID=171437 RepID=UPI0035573199